MPSVVSFHPINFITFRLFPKSLKKTQNPCGVSWIRRTLEEETDYQYMTRCQQISQTKAQALRFRMGMTGGEPDQKPSLPSERGAGQVESTRRHKMSTVLKRPVRSSYWLVICKVTPEFQNSIVIGVDSNGVCITLSRPPPDYSVTNLQPENAGTWPKSTTKVSTVEAPREPDKSSEESNLAENQTNKKHKPMAVTPYTLVDGLV